MHPAFELFCKLLIVNLLTITGMLFPNKHVSMSTWKVPPELWMSWLALLMLLTTYLAGCAISIKYHLSKTWTIFLIHYVKSLCSLTGFWSRTPGCELAPWYSAFCWLSVDCFFSGPRPVNAVLSPLPDRRWRTGSTQLNPAWRWWTRSTEPESCLKMMSSVNWTESCLKMVNSVNWTWILRSCLKMISSVNWTESCLKMMNSGNWAESCLKMMNLVK